MIYATSRQDALNERSRIQRTDGFSSVKCSTTAAVADGVLRASLPSADGDRRNAVVFCLLCVLVATVSVHDALLVVVNHEVIGEMEQNPVGLWLLELQGGEVWLFVLVKLATTSLVCTLLVAMYEYWRRGGMLAVAGVASFQTLLLGYLTIM